jgi:long-chain acyl-CoA synthetase
VYDLASYHNNPIFVEDTGKEIFKKDLQKLGSLLTNFASSKDLFLILAENTVSCISLIISALNVNCVPLLIDSDVKDAILSDFIEDYKPEYICISNQIRKTIIGYILILEYNGILIYRQKLKFRENHLIKPNLAMLLTTSGSTGSKKLVQLSANNIIANGKSISEYLELTPSDRPITSLPIHYSFGFSIVSSHLLAGSTIFVTNKSLVDKSFWDFFRTNHCTSLSGVPITFEILDKIGISKMNLPSLRNLTQAGGKLSDDLTVKFLKFSLDRKINFFVMYGQTEATARISYLHLNRHPSKIGSVGVAIPKGRIEIFDEVTQNPAPQGQVGEIVYFGPNIFLGYSKNRADLIKLDQIKGELRTGDLGYIDDDGFLFITGRNNNYYKIFGKRINLDEMDSLVGNCVCIGEGDKIKVFYKDSREISVIETILTTHVSLNKNIFEIRQINDFPLLPSGKIDKFKLKELT